MKKRKTTFSILIPILNYPKRKRRISRNWQIAEKASNIPISVLYWNRYKSIKPGREGKSNNDYCVALMCSWMNSHPRLVSPMSFTTTQEHGTIFRGFPWRSILHCPANSPRVLLLSIYNKIESISTSSSARSQKKIISLLAIIMQTTHMTPAVKQLWLQTASRMYISYQFQHSYVKDKVQVKNDRHAALKGNNK